MKLFIEAPTEEMVYYSKTYLIFQAAFYFILGTVFLYRNTLQGMGCSLLTVIAGVTEVAMRFVAVFLFVAWWGYNGLCMSNPAAWIGATIYLVIAYYVVIYKRINAAKPPETPERQSPTAENKTETAENEA